MAQKKRQPKLLPTQETSSQTAERLGLTDADLEEAKKYGLPQGSQVIWTPGQSGYPRIVCVRMKSEVDEWAAGLPAIADKVRKARRGLFGK